MLTESLNANTTRISYYVYKDINPTFIKEVKELHEKKTYKADEELKKKLENIRELKSEFSAVPYLNVSINRTESF